LLSIIVNNQRINEIFEKNDVTVSDLIVAVDDMHNVTEILNNTPPITPQKPKINIINLEDMFDDEEKDILNILQNTLGGGSKPKESEGGVPFCVNLNQLAELNKIDDVYGRDEEINKIIETLNRRKNNNVVVVGDPGVGKSSLIHGFAYRIVNNIVPPTMSECVIWKLNVSSLVAGTQFRGMIEDRINDITKKLKENKNSIFFVDDVHNLSSSNKSNELDIMGLLDGIISDGNIKIIVTTNYKGYKSVFENSSSSSNKFQKIVIDKPSKEECYNIMLSIKEEYEKHHKVVYSDEIIKLCINLAERYNSDKTLPTSAIDLMDEVGSYCFLQNTFSITSQELNEMKKELKKDIKTALKKDDIEEVLNIENELENIDKNIAKLNKDSWLFTENNIKVSDDDVYKVISRNTNIPLNKISCDENKKLKNIDEILKKHVIGQDECIDKVSRAIKRGKIGLNKRNKPMASFFFLGSSGSGKTYLSKKIAEEIFGSEKYLVRFDMSEYSDKTSVNKLIGTGSGYVGYDNGGLLTEAIKKQKYCVLLIDEIEKANEEIFNTFLQILDEGVLTDNTGKKIDFKNTIIIMTSNVGTKNASLSKDVDFDGNINSSKKREIIERELKNKFPPEFINRFDEIIHFNNLSNDDLKTITAIELEKLIKNTSNEGYCLKTDEKLVEYLFKKIESDKDGNYGARPILRIIQTEVENKIIDEIIDNPNKKDYTIVVEKNEIKVI
jgi:ATP-dependent Clp protease ATP-binding subunit ClpA